MDIYQINTKILKGIYKDSLNLINGTGVGISSGGLETISKIDKRVLPFIKDCRVEAY